MTSTIYYDVIGGSRAFCLERSTSDIDRYKVDDALMPHYTGSGIETVTYMPIPRFIRILTITAHPSYDIQWWFPGQFMMDTPVSDFIKAERETFVKENSRALFSKFCTYAEQLANSNPGRPDALKCVSYSMLMYAILVRYAEGRTFAEAHRMDGEVQQQLLAMRRKEYTLEEAAALNRQYKEKAEAVKSFYDVKGDTAYLDWVVDRLCEILDIEPLTDITPSWKEDIIL